MQIGKKQSRTVISSFKREADLVLLQREIPDYVNVVAAKFAKEHGKLVILDAGGRDEPLSDTLLANIDYFSPNEVLFKHKCID